MELQAHQWGRTGDSSQASLTFPTAYQNAHAWNCWVLRASPLTSDSGWDPSPRDEAGCSQGEDGWTQTQQSPPLSLPLSL